uniref:Uncharacterized protein n=1 Tax=Anguilla anguilla TaxID=7936 RepID=A0A0E9W8D3_ANGAN
MRNSVLYYFHCISYSFGLFMHNMSLETVLEVSARIFLMDMLS